MKRLLMVFGFIALTSCSANNVIKKDFIIGTWSNIDVGSDPSVSYGEKTYFKNGEACGFILDSPSRYGPAEFTVYKSKWRVENNTLISIVQKSNSEFLNPGEEIKDEIVSVDKKIMVLKGATDGNEYKRYRVPEERGLEICDITSKFMP